MKKELSDITHHYKEEHCGCDAIIAEAHEIYNRALEIFATADELITDDLKKAVRLALCIAEKSLILVDEGLALESKAVCMLEECSDECPYDVNKSKCKPLRDEAFKYYDKETKVLKKIVEMLRIITCKIKIYGKFDKLGDKYFDKYIECIHKKDPCEW